MLSRNPEPAELQTEVKKTSYRWRVVALLFCATTINYLDRQVLGLLKPTLEADFGWTESDFSHIVMAFQAAYAFSLIGFGAIIDKIGTKIGYVISVVVWSIAAMLHAVATGTFSFGFMRAILGLGEAGNFPVAIKATAEWFPKKERALATGIFNSGANIGAVVAPIMVPWILGAYGWQEAFLITGALGFVWLIFWWRFYELPAKQSRINKAEYDYIHSDNEADTSNEAPVKWLQLFKIRQTWAFVFGKMLTDPIWWFFLYWLPSYFAEAFKLNLSKPSPELVIVYTATTVGSIGGGYLSGYFIKKGWPVFRARKTSMLIFAFLVMPIMAAQYTTNIWQAVVLISLAAAAHQAWSANIFTTASDMFPKKAVSSVVGIGGMAGSVGGILFPLLVGIILDNYKAAGNIGGGYNVIFIICGFAYLLAWGVMHVFSPKMERVDI
ncbi:ACS family hexuronate transporter-like MFS transporter [Dyadobacter sp. BE34]|uniref:ACS family hexuronate transporter-like MFS transporter n=1 Tax=Dyadobacter fermentans TaxID=94254 RepID=A0ABU1R509_9BACT|nr:MULTISPECIES: MFS transporter [Dyadobacter]MDR6807999.1 ACS family hexuronate transporter-like MFS transporter [Dyadobacter fermentans]MDR7046185.1 ACS family hexuronate transporter-like MFS transporter [Dyadobacter sp. BE242]MDR7200498.1 ACS family hexuronate transporter-like MFS transporter [Dyadobacter sp. BE34]MDR7218458.1 ACS family hexuronate transporter-like MFS transporter [Dyadobacter sp. BE31]MDR7266389.1 ACS family hexuronate transporter-like MFS transporter [Dyadobacter sp. BE32